MPFRPETRTTARTRTTPATPPLPPCRCSGCQRLRVERPARSYPKGGTPSKARGSRATSPVRGVSDSLSFYRYCLTRCAALRTAEATNTRGRGSLADVHAFSYSLRARSLRASSKAPTAPANSSSRPRLLFSASNRPLRTHGISSTVYPGRRVLTIGPKRRELSRQRAAGKQLVGGRSARCYPE